MRVRVKKEAKILSWADKCVRLAERMKDPEWRRYGMTLLAGKMLGLIVLAMVVLIVTAVINRGTAYADDATTQERPSRRRRRPVSQRRQRRHR